MRTLETLERSSLADITRFLREKRVAVVGVSTNPQDFTRKLLQEFLRRGYDVVPVNPSATVIEGLTFLPSVSNITPPLKAALLLTSPTVSDKVVRECAAAGIEMVWMHRASGAGAVSMSAVEFCRQRGIAVIAGECPLMFLEPAGFPHRVHGFIRKVCGKYPR